MSDNQETTPATPSTSENSPAKPSKRLLKKNSDISPEIVINNPPQKKRRWLWIVLALVIILGVLIIPPAMGAWWFVDSFTSAAGVSYQHLRENLREGWQTQPQQADGRTNFLILGLDSIDGQRENSQLTDTIIIASYSYDDKKLTLIPIPRDLWIGALKTKINAIYYYGELSEDTTGHEFTRSVVTDITGLPIHHTFVIRMQMLQHMIDALGGIYIDVPLGFTDTQFPRSDVNLATASAEELYETVSFEKGLQKMDGAMALKYIRSRHSEDLEAGTDLARTRRQQQVIQAIIAQTASTQTLTNPRILGELYKQLRTHISTEDISDATLIAMAKQNGGDLPLIISLGLPVEDENNIGVLVHPDVEKHNQWVYEPKDPTWSEIKNYLKNQLNNQ